jgi:putative multiple sugar transport system substrate-binding protein
MAPGSERGTSFMEDYTYHFGPGEPKVLGAHMLEVCPSLATAQPSCEIHPLSIGDREDPVRLVFDAAPGDGVVIGLADLGDRFRLVLNEVEVVAPDEPLPNLPVARAVWKPAPSAVDSRQCWLTAGGPTPHGAHPGGRHRHARRLRDMVHTELLVFDARRHQRLRRPVRGTRPTTGCSGLAGRMNPSTSRRTISRQVSHCPEGRRNDAQRLATQRWAMRRGEPRRVRFQRETGRAQAPGAARNNAGALVGVHDATKSSERWTRTGANSQRRAREDGLQGRPAVRRERHPDAGQPARQPDRQGREGPDRGVDRRHGDHDAAAERQDKGIKVIAYDRLIRNSENVDFYTSFDNYKVGVQQATSLLVGLGIKKEDGSDGDKKGPFNIEVFAGSPDDNNATFFFNGGMDTLKPYIDNGTLKIKSGQKDFKTVAILRWDPARAQARMEDLLTKHYGGGARVDGVLSPVRRPEHRHPVGAQEQRLRHRRSGLPGRHRPGRREGVGQVDHRGRAVRDDLQGHPQARRRHRQDDRRGPQGPAARGQQHQGLQQRRQVVPSYLLDPIIVYKNNYKETLIDTATTSRRPPVGDGGRRSCGVPTIRCRLPDFWQPAADEHSKGRPRWQTPFSRCAGSRRPSPASRRSRTSTSRSAAARSTRSAARTAPASRR